MLRSFTAQVYTTGLRSTAAATQRWRMWKAAAHRDNNYNSHTTTKTQVQAAVHLQQHTEQRGRAGLRSSSDASCRFSSFSELYVRSENALNCTDFKLGRNVQRN